jgi:hypothetical protein
VNQITATSAKQGQTNNISYDSRAKKAKISQASPQVDSINLISPLVLSNPDVHIVLSNSATVSEEKPHADLQALSVLELETLEESALHAFEYSDHVVVFGEKRFAVPVSSEINSFLKFKRAHPNSGGKAHVLTYPQ